MIALSVVAYFSKKNSPIKVVFVLLFLFIATYVIYIPAFTAIYDPLLAIMGGFGYVLRVVTIDADVMDFYDVINTQIGYPILVKGYVALQCILHVSLPTISALTAVTVLFRCFSSIQLLIANSLRRPLFVFSEVNERSLQIAKSLRKIKCDIVFANSTQNSLNSENDDKKGRIFKEDSIEKITIKRKRNKDVYFFCISEDEEVSLDQTLQLIEKYSKRGKEEQKHIHIYQVSRHRDFAIFIDSADKDHLDVQCFNEYEMMIYSLLDKYPLYKYANPDIHVLLYGLSQVNIVAIKAIAWCGQISNISLKVSVVGVDIERQIEELKLNVPGLFLEKYDFNFYNCKSKNEAVNVIVQNCMEANYLIVSEKTDNETLDQAILLRRLFYKNDKKYSRCPPIFCYIKAASKFKIAASLSTAESNPKRKMSYSLTPFGNIEEIYSYETIVDSNLEKLAKNVHLVYEEIFSNGDINVEEALERYNVFEVNKRANRANALHIRYKLNMLGLDYTDDENVQEVRLQDFFSEEYLETLSISEHNRWMAFLESEGWEQSHKEDVYLYRESGISKGRHNCPILKMHPYICEYEKLEELSMDLEGKDTTVYDKELILRIPDILGDKWNIAGKKYRITKLG